MGPIYRFPVLSMHLLSLFRDNMSNLRIAYNNILTVATCLAATKVKISTTFNNAYLTQTNSCNNVPFWLNEASKWRSSLAAAQFSLYVWWNFTRITPPVVSCVVQWFEKCVSCYRYICESVYTLLTLVPCTKQGAAASTSDKRLQNGWLLMDGCHTIKTHSLKHHEELFSIETDVDCESACACFRCPAASGRPILL